MYEDNFSLLEQKHFMKDIIIKIFPVILLSYFSIISFGDADPADAEYRQDLQRNWLEELYKGDRGIKTWQDAHGAIDGRRYDKSGDSGW